MRWFPRSATSRWRRPSITSRSSRPSIISRWFPPSAISRWRPPRLTRRRRSRSLHPKGCRHRMCGDGARLLQERRPRPALIIFQKTSYPARFVFRVPAFFLFPAGQGRGERESRHAGRTPSGRRGGSCRTLPGRAGRAPRYGQLFAPLRFWLNSPCVWAG